ncbi:heavy metal-binding protein HIP-like [Mercenaria mercenaria]|uniref:heavy metal-binding protein HIP-like n=1 Tax=Mercenaria mercenaria TaxID=6596 RepID=UPI00234E8EE4|nr:heavy metal-binding protein HIP-like [Mercenaria mercenaria]
MVRIEFQIERMKTEMGQPVKAVENMKTGIYDTLKAFHTKLETYDQNVQRIEAFETKLTKTVSEKQKENGKNIDDKLAALENKTVEILDKKIQELQAIKDEVLTPTVAFKARLDSDIVVSNGQTIVFPAVLFNEEDSYNQRTGKFTTPVSGTYMFTIAFCRKKVKTLVAGIMADRKKYTVTLMYGDANDECLTGDTVAVLTSGQVVWVHVLSGSSIDAIFHQYYSYYSYRRNTFSVVLIHG